MSPLPQSIVPRPEVFYPQCLCDLGIVFENFGDPKSPIGVPVIPKTASVFINSYKEADTFSVTFDAARLPVVPELIKAGSLSIYMFQTRGIGQQPERTVAGEDWFGYVPPTIQGIFDEASMDFSEDGRWVSIDGKDYTSLFLAKQWGSPVKASKKKNIPRGMRNKRVPSGLPLDRVLQQIIDEVESAEVMTLRVEPDELLADMPIVGRAEGRCTKRGLPVKDKDNYWDVMYDLAVRYGFILFVRGLDVVLTRPRNYLEGKSNVRKMAWGRNLTALRMKRKIGREQVPVIEVRSYDETRRQVLKGKYPKNPKAKPVTGLGTIHDEVRVYHVLGVRSVKTLEQIAENAYNLLARSEQSIEIETRDLTDLEGNDILDLAAGDAVSISLEPYTTDLLEGKTVDQRYVALVELGYDRTVARTIASSFEKLDIFRRPFRLREANLEWTEGDGLDISITLQNYVNITGELP